MFDVGGKDITERVCVARCQVEMAESTLERIGSGSVPKGDVLATARIAGIQAAKRTDQWIPLAHPLPLDSIEVELEPDPERGAVRVEATARTHWRTGVEMEALVAASAAALTIYDMCKAIDREMRITDLRLSAKRGGKSGSFVRSGESVSGWPDGAQGRGGA